MHIIILFCIVEDVADEKLLCTKRYSAYDLTQIKDAIEDLYYFEFVVGRWQSMYICLR